MESEHHRADSNDGQDELWALCGVGKSYAKQSEEDHARDQGHLPALFVGYVAHDGMGSYANCLEHRGVDTYLERGEVQIFTEIDRDEHGYDVVAQGAEARKDDHGDKDPVLQKNARTWRNTPLGM